VHNLVVETDILVGTRNLGGSNLVVVAENTLSADGYSQTAVESNQVAMKHNSERLRKSVGYHGKAADQLDKAAAQLRNPVGLQHILEAVEETLDAG